MWKYRIALAAISGIAVGSWIYIAIFCIKHPWIFEI